MRRFRLHVLGLFAAASLSPTGTGRRSAVAVLGLLLLLAWAPFAASRPVTPRGELTTDERVTIDVFEKSKRSVVYISTCRIYVVKRRRAAKRSHPGPGLD